MQTIKTLTDAELWQCLDDADSRKSDSGLPMDVRIRSLQTYACCLREAGARGFDYCGLKLKFAQVAA